MGVMDNSLFVSLCKRINATPIYFFSSKTYPLNLPYLLRNKKINATELSSMVFILCLTASLAILLASKLTVLGVFLSLTFFLTTYFSLYPSYVSYRFHQNMMFQESNSYFALEEFTLALNTTGSVIESIKFVAKGFIPPYNEDFRKIYFKTMIRGISPVRALEEYSETSLSPTIRKKLPSIALSAFDQNILEKRTEIELKYVRNLIRNEIRRTTREIDGKITFLTTFGFIVALSICVFTLLKPIKLQEITMALLLYILVILHLYKFLLKKREEAP